MKEWKKLHIILGILFIIVGVTFYITPIPGTTLLIVLGFIWLMGKDRTSYFLKKILGEKVFGFLKLEQVIEKL
ncbi:hypothetical protein KKG24_00510 [Patescibacteria group bacterium]|nr:hypothetical protein [Patescibacteria group bacterium]